VLLTDQEGQMALVDLLKEDGLPVVEGSLDEEKTLLRESRVEDPLLMV